MFNAVSYEAKRGNMSFSCPAHIHGLSSTDATLSVSFPHHFLPSSPFILLHNLNEGSERLGHSLHCNLTLLCSFIDTDLLASLQIKHMMAFIEQEANEKAEEIDAKVKYKCSD